MTPRPARSWTAGSLRVCLDLGRCPAGLTYLMYGVGGGDRSQHLGCTVQNPPPIERQLQAVLLDSRPTRVTSIRGFLLSQSLSLLS